MVNTDKLPVDRRTAVPVREAAKTLKDAGYKIANSSIDAFVSLKDINKIYPNGFHAVHDFNMEAEKGEFIVLNFATAGKKQLNLKVCLDNG